MSTMTTRTLLDSGVLPVVLPRPDEVREYLDQHIEVGELLPPLCAQAREAFGEQAELSLELYRDPEIDDCYLTLYVRQANYDAKFLQRLRHFGDQHAEELYQEFGHILVTTDFRYITGRE